MLTVDKLRIWEKFRGDGDVFGRVPERDLAGISEDEWRQIALFVSNIRMMRNVKVTASFQDDFNQRMNTLVANEEARDMLRRLAEQAWP